MSLSHDSGTHRMGHTTQHSVGQEQVIQGCLPLSWPGKKQSRADFPFTNVGISNEISPNALLERKTGSAVFLARPTQPKKAFDEFT
jgi:hypothetical protein